MLSQMALGIPNRRISTSLMRDYLIVYFAPWNYWERENRSQPLARALAELGFSLLYVNYPGVRILQPEPGSLVKSLRQVHLGTHVERVDGNLYMTRGRPWLYKYHWRDILYVADGAATRKQRLLVEQIASIAKKRPFRDKQLIVLSSRMISELFVKLTKPRLSVLDFEDPWSRFSSVWNIPREVLLPALVRFSKTADLAVANGVKIAQISEQEFFGRKVHVLPNGVDVKKLGRRTGVTRPPDYPEGRSVLFSGVVDDRIDFDLLEPSFQKFKTVNFVFLGAVAHHFMGQTRRVSRIHRNVWFLGHKSIDEISTYLQQADLFMIPYRLNSVWSFVFPSKIYEYFVFGRETISTFPITDITAEFQFAIKVASNPSTFAECVEVGLKRAPRSEEIAMHGLRQTWHERARLLSELLISNL